MKKYKFTGKVIIHNKIMLKQIQRLSDGLIGGWIASEKNLSQFGRCFVFNNAKVYGKAKVFNNANIMENAEVCGKARVFGNALVFGKSSIEDFAWVFGYARVTGRY
jgi:hypothetical protein